MTPKQPPRQLSPTDPAKRDEPPESPPPVAEQEPADGETPPADPAEAPDLYEDLWDPDMDTRPERIRRTRARTRPEARRGGAPPRGKRREGP